MKQVRLYHLGFWCCLLAFVLAGCQSANVRLQQAIERNDAQAVKNAVERGADKNSCANDGWRKSSQGLTPLGVAISSRRVQAALALIEAGADVNRRDYRSQNPLGYAMDSGQAEVLPALLKAGADPNTPHMLRAVLSEGEAPLTRALQGEQVQAIKVLLQHGAKADHRDTYGRTAFWHTGGKLSPAEAARLSPQLREIRQLLLQAGANPDPRDYKGRTYTTVQKLGIDYRKEAETEKNLAWTDQSGKSADKQTGLLKAQAPVDKSKRAPKPTNQAAQARLYQAIEKGDVEAVKKALNSGAAINAFFGKAATSSYNEYETPLILAIESEHANVVTALLNAGADPMVSASNWPPLHHAARTRNPAIVKALLERGVEPNYGTYGAGETALMHAVSSGSVECVKLLLDKGANPDAKTVSGNGMSYFLFKNEDVINKLLKQASDKRKTTESG